MRAIRDLRDLVNVSRLTYREDSDNEFEPPVHLNNTIKNQTIQTSAKSKIKLASISPSSSNSSFFSNSKYIIQNNSLLSNSSSSLILKDRDQLLNRNSFPKLKLNNPKKPLPPLKSTTSSNSLNSELKKSIEPLDLDGLEGAEQEEQDEDYNDDIKLTSSFKNRSFTGNFDDILTYIDASVVSDWLNRANRYLKKMLKWHQDNSNLYEANTLTTKSIKYESFILFCNFWLGNNEHVKLNDKQRRNLIEMEYSIISDEVTQAFQIGIDSQKVLINDINQLLKALFKEYPIQLLSFRGTYLVLDFIDILSSDRDIDYKKLLSDVKCRTLNKQFAQWLLSIRSFALINMCWSIVKFYRKSVEQNIKINKNLDNKNSNLIEQLDGRLSSLSVLNKTENSSPSSLRSSVSSNSSSSLNENKEIRSKSAKLSNKLDLNTCTILPSNLKYDYYLQAVFKHDLADVLHYLITSKKCDPYQKDDKDRNLIFLAVINEKPKILNYLVKRWPTIDINEACDSGNTALHAAVNKGKINLVEILLESLSNIDKLEHNESVKVLDINKANPKCMNATALHLAVWNDFNEIALKLIQSNADPYLKMNAQSTAFDLAKENSNLVLYDLLYEYSNFNNKKN